MARYNEKAVINFLLNVEFKSGAEWGYAKNAKVANEFGCTLVTAGKWIQRAMNTGLIEYGNNEFVLVDQQKKHEKEQQSKTVDNAVKSGKVVRMQSFRIKQRRAQEVV